MNIETANRLLEYRKANGYSQEELAEKIGVSRQAISKWERCESSPDTDNLIALAKLYGVTIDELLNGSSKPEKAEADTEQQTAEDKAEATKENEDKKNTDNHAKTNYTNGANFNDGKDHVNIGWNGIHVESENGDHVHIGSNGVHVNGDAKNHVFTKAPKNPWLHALLPTFAVLFYLLVGFTTEKGWAIGWIVFLFIPIIETAVTAIKNKNPSAFAYPVFVTALFLMCGMLFSVWHPTWIIFITIPIYYVLCDAYKKTRQSKEDDYSQYRSSNGTTYYSPGVSGTEKPAKHNNAAAITISIICGMTIIAVVAIVSVFGFLKTATSSALNSFVPEIFSMIDNGGETLNYENGNAYSVGNSEVPADGISEISVEWVNGNINIEYYDGDTISFSESSPKSEDYAMRYLVDGNELKIKFCKSGLHSLNSYSKALNIYLPKNIQLNNIEVESVSSDVFVKEITSRSFDFETVSGDLNLTGGFYEADFSSVSGNILVTDYTVPRSVDLSTVSGDCRLALPADISGFRIEYETVSGDVTGNDFYIDGGVTIGEGKQVYGDGSAEIDFSTVSGDFEIAKAE